MPKHSKLMGMNVTPQDHQVRVSAGLYRPEVEARFKRCTQCSCKSHMISSKVVYYSNLWAVERSAASLNCAETVPLVSDCRDVIAHSASTVERTEATQANVGARQEQSSPESVVRARALYPRHVDAIGP